MEVAKHNNSNNENNIWYQKSTDTDTILKFRGSPPLKTNKNCFNVLYIGFSMPPAIINFFVAHRKNQETWTENQYPTEWSSSIVNETLRKTVIKQKVILDLPKKTPKKDLI